MQFRPFQDSVLASCTLIFVFLVQNKMNHSINMSNNRTKNGGNGSSSKKQGLVRLRVSAICRPFLVGH